jgi:hypothetical protein
MADPGCGGNGNVTLENSGEPFQGGPTPPAVTTDNNGPILANDSSVHVAMSAGDTFSQNFSMRAEGKNSLRKTVTSRHADMIDKDGSLVDEQELAWINSK